MSPPLAPAFVEHILDALDDAVIQLDATFALTYVNASAARLLGSSRQRLLGKSLWLELPELESSAFGVACRRVMSERSEARLTDFYAPFAVSLEAHLQYRGDSVLVIWRDVTEQRRLAARLEHVEDELRLVSDTVPALVAYIDSNETYRFVNRTAETWYGMPAEALLGLHVSAVLGDDAFGPLREHLSRALAGETFTVRAHVPYPTGPRWVESTFVPRRRGSDRPDGTVLMAIDVTERQHEEIERADLVARLQASEGRHRRFHESGVIGVVHWRRGGTIFDANDAFLGMVGYSGEDLATGAIDWQRLSVPAFEDLDRAAMAELDARGLSTPYEKELFHKDGHRVPVLFGAAFLKDSTSEGVAWIYDNTSRKQVEERQALLLSGGRALAESSLDATRTLMAAVRLLVERFADSATIDLADDDGHLGATVVAHRDPEREAVLKHLREQPPQAGGQPVPDVVRTGRAETLRYDAPLLATLATAAELEAVAARTAPRCAVVAPLRSRGRLLGLLSFFSAARDYDADDLAMAEELARQLAVTLDNARLLEAAQAERRHAEETSRAKDEFLAMVSHELRTPLNAMLGWTSLIRAGHLVEERRLQGMEVIERNVRAQVKLVEDLLDISRVITGKLRLDVQSVDVAQVVAAAVEALRPASDGKDIRLTQTVDVTVGPVQGDPDRLRQVVYNLLTNAVRHTPRGGHVDVVVSTHPSHVEVRVTDDGEGIAPELVPHVFERFRQGEGGTTRRYGGLGLGLAIVKHVLELHGGTIEVASEGRGRGATFVARIPIGSTREPSSGRPSSVPPSLKALQRTPATRDADLSDLLVLVVDDEDDARELLRTILELSHARVLVAGSVKEALELFVERRPSVILSDIGMPYADGYALIEEIRRLPEAHGGKTPAIALTAFARLEDRTRALLAGYTMHLTKPVKSAELLVAVGVVSGRLAPTSQDP